MTVVFKYAFKITKVQTLKLPVGYKILKIGYQNGQPMLWAEVHPDPIGMTELRLLVVGTGSEIPMGGEYREYIDTLIDDVHGFVWHVYKAKD